jgi:tRNA isopentenyl-2-thiomethyl-A-37 hydroxylase MiaE
MIHLAEIIDEGIVCYDGNHRREVFNLLNDKEFVCIVDVMFSATQNDVYKAFNAINKAVQLPAIYIDEQNNNDNVKTEILQLVKKYETKYKPFLSTSSRCHAPQFNRDNFIDNIYNIYISFDRTVSIKQLNELFEKLNIEYQHEKICRPHSLYKKSLIDKCKKHNFWLFIDKTISFEHVEFLLKHNVEK